MNTLKKVADKIATPDSHHADGTYAHSDTYSSTTTTGPIIHTESSRADAHMMTTGSTAVTGSVVETHQVGTVDVVENIQTVRKVPVMETTRTVDTVNTGMAGLDIHSHKHGMDVHAHKHGHHHDIHDVTKVELAATTDHRTVVVEPVVQEVVRKDTLVQIQPVIHQEVEKEVVKHVTQHINEAPAPSVAGSVTLKPVVQEHIHTHVVEEVHPVIHREIVVQEVERVEEHITEHIVAPTKHIHEVVEVVAPVHIHDAHCHHAIATDRLTTIIPPTGALAVNTGATTITTREVLTDRAGPAITTGHTREIVTDTHLASGMTTGMTTASSGVVIDKHSTSGVILDKHATSGVIVDRHVAPGVIVDKHTSVIHPGDRIDGGHIVAGGHSERVVTVTEVDEHGHHSDHAHVVHEHDAHKHHHHLHLPHILGGHKKDEVVVTTERHTEAL